jgi:release factor glutamine methyltransferase
MTEDEIILTHILQCSRSDLYLKKPQLSLHQQNQLNLFKKRRAEGEPLQYILGECEFMGILLKVDPRVLIPRPETELLVETILKRMKEYGKEISGLDIGTGSGNIPIALVKHESRIRMVSIDVSSGALELARENAAHNGVLSKIDFINADAFEWFNQAQIQRFSFIVSNPPYVKAGDMAGLPKDVQKEPQTALNGGEDGLRFYEHIVKNVEKVLKPGGLLFFEIGEAQGKSLENLLTRHGSFVNILVNQDYNQRDRIVQAQLKFR